MKTIQVRGIPINIYKSKLARKITLSIRPFRGIRITIPHYVSYSNAEEFAKEKEDWVISNAKNIRILEEKRLSQNKDLFNGTKFHQLSLVQHQKETISVRLTDGMISIKYPFEFDQNSPQLKKAIKKGIELALKKEAKQFLPERLEYYSLKLGMNYNALSIKNMKSRWGSCTGKNNINLTIHLMRLPNHLIDYVILHELAHTIVKNHGKEFWTLLDKISGGARLLDKELKSHRIIIY